MLPGTRLGPYKILSALGAGGMGEVYKARDTRLDRTVAVKILPAAVAADPQFRARFEREARAIAALDHPHICALHDVGEHEGICYLVMQHLEGETLAARLVRTKGSLPLDQALAIAIDIADALDKAHRAGITHRDLKPANIMLTKTGAKLLDFGLAKLHGPAAPISVSGMTKLATNAPNTAQGTILGTVHYMAPEQVEGREADARSDIWALGAVIYEMTTGRRPFDGESPASIIGAILKDDVPAISQVQPGTPPLVDSVVATCLAKDPDERWQSVADAKRALGWIAEMGSRSNAVTTGTRSRWFEGKYWVVSTIILFLALVGTTPLILRELRERPSPPLVVRLSLNAPPGTTFAAANASVPSTQLALSPDGRNVAFVASAAGKQPSLWVRALDDLTAKSLPDTDGASYPFWSPDSRMVAFFARGKLLKAEVAGGVPQNVCDAPAGRGGTWGRGDVILFGTSSGNSLYRVSPSGGTPVSVTTVNSDRQESAHRFPQFLPDGRRFLFFVRSPQPERRGIYVGSLDSRETKLLVRTNLRGLYDPSGFILFVRDGALMAQALDPGRLDLTGDPIQVTARVGGSSADYAAFTISDSGTLAYASGTPQDSQLIWYDRRGASLGAVGVNGDYVSLQISPDQGRVAFSRVDPETNTPDLWLFDMARRARSRFTFDPSTDAFSVWSPDGSRIVFRSDRGGSQDLYVKSSSGATPETVFLASANNKMPTDWSSDGRYIVYHSPGATTGIDLWVLPMTGDQTPRVFLQTPFNEMQGRLSPDGHWMAYTSDESGALEVYVRPFPSGTEKWLISTGGGSEPAWQRDTKELFYLATDRKLMAVPIKSGATFEAGVPSPLFETHVGPINPEYRNQYTVSSDGSRFLVNTVLENTPSSPITVVLNWTAASKQ